MKNNTELFTFYNIVVEKYIFVNTGYHFFYDPKWQILHFLRSNNVKYVNIFDVEIMKETNCMTDWLEHSFS